MLKNGPVRPSATNHDVESDASAAASWPPFHRRAGVDPKYWARSTVIGCELVTAVENALPFRPWHVVREHGQAGVRRHHVISERWCSAVEQIGGGDVRRGAIAVGEQDVGVEEPGITLGEEPRGRAAGIVFPRCPP